MATEPQISPSSKPTFRRPMDYFNHLMRTHTITRYAATFPPTYVANGIVGPVIGIPNSLLDGSALLNGYSVRRAKRLKVMSPRLSDCRGVALDGLWMSQRPDLVHFESQAYDFATGELKSQSSFGPMATPRRIEVLTFPAKPSRPSFPPGDDGRNQMATARSRSRELPIRLGLSRSMPAEPLPDPGWLIADAPAVLMESRDDISTCGAAKSWNMWDPRR